MMERYYTNLLQASVFVLLASCATLNDEQKYERADRSVLAADQFRLKQIACRKSGGLIVMQVTAMASKMSRPTRHGFESATCVRP